MTLFNESKANEILERDIVGIGTGAHINIPKKHLGKKARIIITAGDNELCEAEVRKNLIIEDFMNADEILERTVTPYGNSYHVPIPSKHKGKIVKVIIVGGHHPCQECKKTIQTTQTTQMSH